LAFIGSIVSVVAARRLLGAAAVDLAAIETRALFLIADNAIGCRDLLEFVLGLLVARVEVRMQLLGKLAIGALNILLRGVPFYAQNFIGITAHACLSLGAPKNTQIVLRRPHINRSIDAVRLKPGP